VAGPWLARGWPWLARGWPVVGPVTAGVDTHGDTHHAAVLDRVGREIGDSESPATPAGHRQLLGCLRGHGPLERVGVEGTGAHGAGLAAHLREQGVSLVEVDRSE
jgi:transposase